ncbi:MAG: RarD protein [Homoserinimonas sp.]|nr:RarD protein [Homoserinimonas sp.]
MSSEIDRRNRSGLLYALGAYGIWGVLPMYFVLVAPVGAVEIVAWRILFSLVVCAFLLTVTQTWSAFRAIVRQPRLVLVMGLAGLVIYANWQIFVIAAVSGHILETSLGYFINPIVTVILAVVVLHERLRAVQWAAVGISAIAVVVLAVSYGSIPWISLGIAATFGLYGLIKKQVGVKVDALTGLTLETMWLVPVASGILIFVATGAGLAIGTVSPGLVALTIASGVITAIPLLLFASAARRLTLVSIGLVQYLAPLLSFAFGTFVMHESMPAERWIGFGLVWLALIVLTIDSVHHGRASRRALPLSA